MMTTRASSVDSLVSWAAAALCAGLAGPASAAPSSDGPLLAWEPVPDERLAQMRGGMSVGPVFANFAIERVVRIDGEVVARTQLILSRLDQLSRGALPDAQLVGNLANLVQVGQGNAAGAPGSTIPVAASPAAQPVNGGTVSTPNVASGLSADWGPALSQAVGIATGGTDNARPAPVAVGAAPAAAAQAGASSPPSAGSSASVTGAAAASSLPGTFSISVPIGAGRIVVSGIPNASALATSIQNSVQATRIETETTISASLASLSALRSMTFAASLRQQAIDAARR